ncbi:Sensor histidine kinase DesK [Jeotgalicoccus saudimassiliensis]|uniref:histidine kinase n=1 Tax=Jeotgalicoccus saudimassiliensis TaxID=1461582 RepID=A0A078M7U6_9STAP|nr:histidine kinase [Jeotgalicoccus saudimassiliensis]CEA03503.1 Sensor histidine kinase DesK [Jeotgalicoccus saudimassiliensis]
MSNIYVKIMIFTVLSVFYLLTSEEAHITVILLSFITAFSTDAIRKKYMLFTAAVIFAVLLFMDINYLYFLPVISHIIFMEYGMYGIMVLIPIVLFQEWVLLFLSIFIFYTTVLSEKLSEAKQLNRKMRDQLTEDNMRLKAQRNELMKTHEKDIYMAGLNERNRIARDMHDALGHSLSSSILLIESLQYVKDEETLHHSLKQLQDRLKIGMEDVRHSIHNLYDTSIDLEARIESYLVEMENYSKELIYDVNITLTHEEKIDMLSLVREALTNIRKHSNASAFTVIIKEHPKFLALTIKDNGNPVKEFNKGMGLQSMKETVQKYGGVLNTFNDDGFIVHAIFYMEGLRNENSNS